MTVTGELLDDEMRGRISRREFVHGATQSAATAAFLGAAAVVGTAAGAAVRLDRDGSDIRFTAGKTLVCRIPATATGDSTDTGASAQFSEMSNDRATRTFRAGKWEVREQIRLVAQDLFEWRRTWKNTSGAAAQADFCMEVESGYAPEFTLVPAISYDGNPDYGRTAPKGLLVDGGPGVFSAYRSSVPAGNYSEGAGWSIFVFVSTRRPSFDCGFSLVPKNIRMTHRLLWPEQDNLRLRGTGAFREELEVAPNQSFEAVAYLVVCPAAERRRAWREGMDHAWRLNRHNMKPSYAPKRLWDLGTQFARETLWYEKSDFVGFNIGVNFTNGAWVQRPNIRFEIGWCGQGAAYGAALLQDYIWNKNAESLAKGEKALDFWAENGRLKCGLFYTHYDLKLGVERYAVYNATFLGRPAKPGEKFVDTCNLGHGAYQFLLASELAEKCGKHKPLWRQVGLDACNFFVDHALPDGTFGKAWSLDGECLAPGFTTGAHILWPMLKAYRMTRDRRYLETARRAFRTYVNRDLDRVVCTGGAIDADTIDKESGLPLLLAALDLYELTGEKEYLRDAELAGYYLATWQWHYTVPFDRDSPVLQMGYDTFGGTSVDVMSQGQDPWGELIAMGWLRLAAATKRDIWRDRAVQCFNQGTIGISDGNLVLKGFKRPAGGQNEFYSFTLRRADGKRLYGDFNNWLVAWPNAHRLITLMHWPKWQDFEVRS